MISVIRGTGVSSLIFGSYCRENVCDRYFFNKLFVGNILSYLNFLIHLRLDTLFIDSIVFLEELM